jgi:hypothetical protein
MCLAGAALAQPIPAFPGAEGAGAYATGGRPKVMRGVLRGELYHVTTLDPDPAGIIPGSLMYGMKDSNFYQSFLLNGSIDPGSPSTFDVKPRIIVFDVGGTIVLNNLANNSDIDITPRNFTLAGQTAPGGITIYGAEFNPGHRAEWDFNGTPSPTNNLVIRNLAVRTHNANEKDAFWVPLSNSIVDHVSGAWHTDEGVSITDGAKNITLQHSIVGPGWNNPDGDGSQIEGYTPAADISVHHNLYIHNDARIIRVGEKEGPGVELDFRNNVIFNFNDSKAGYSVSSEPSFTNFVNNYYIGGPGNASGDNIFSSGGSLTRIYQSGNLLDLNKNGVADGTDPGWSRFAGTETQLAAPLAVPHGVTQTPAEALHTVQNYAGARWWDRDFLDSRLIQQLSTYGQGTVAQTGQVLSTIDPADVNAVVNAPLQTRPADYDSDNDGMPDYWEIEHGLNPNSAPGDMEWRADFDGDGYINIEEFINELAEWPAPFDIVFTGGTNSRYEQITNWSITRPSPGEADTTTHWQPSKYDVAVINNGTVSVTSVGQHAGTIRLASGPADNATLNVSSGWLKVTDAAYGPGTGEIIIGSNPNATAALNLSGGYLKAKTLSKNAGSTFSFTGGELNVEEVGFSLTNDGGLITIGASAGTLQVAGDLVLNSGILEIEIGGTNPMDYDRVMVDGLATLGGTLVIELIDPSGGDTPFVPQLGDQFTFLESAAGTIEMFDHFDLPEPGPGLAWEFTTGTTTSLSIVAAPFPLLGDFNNGGVVDALDYTLWRNHLGESDETNISFNGDGGDVSESDYLVWKTHYGDKHLLFGGAGGLATVPEPGLHLVLLVAALAAFSKRRGSRFA